MAKSSSKNNSNKSVNSRYSSTKGNGRLKPMTPKAGYTQSRRRYGEGGTYK